MGRGANNRFPLQVRLPFRWSKAPADRCPVARWAKTWGWRAIRYGSLLTISLPIRYPPRSP